jgi:hypothetical protein
MVWFGGIVTDSSFLSSYGTNRCTVYCVSVAFQQQRLLYLRLFGVTAQPTETNLIQQSTTIDTEKEKESEEIGMED